MHVLLYPDYIRGMLKDIKFSEQGSSAREREEATYTHFFGKTVKCNDTPCFVAS